MNLFLDDVRKPSDVDWVDFDYDSRTWHIVKNYDQFVQAILENEYEVFSLDHDLCRLSTMECIRSSSKKEPFDYSRVKDKTGLHCAKFLKQFYQNKGKEIPPYLVHSLNPQGRENIIKELGTEKLLATHSVKILFDKADEILHIKKQWANQ